MHLHLLSALVLGIFSISHERALARDGDRCHNCKCSCWKTSVVICTGIGVIPECLPTDTKELYITNSPELSELGDLSYYSKLRVLSISQTNLGTIDNDTFQHLDDIETFKIISAANLTTFSKGTFDDRRKLKKITVTFCPVFSNLPNRIFSNLDALETLDLSYNNIEEIPEDLVCGSTNLTSIDISHNTGLKHLPRYVFSQLQNLRRLVLSNNSLAVLYPEHVSAPSDSESLDSFKGRYNSWRCYEMCEFIEWLNQHDSFRDIAKMGYCSYPESWQNKRVLELTPDQVCLSANVVLQVLLSLLFISVLALTCCFLCVARHCIVGMCCDNSSRRVSDDPRGVQRGQEHRNATYVDGDDPDVNPTSRNGVETRRTIIESDVNVTNWNINCIDPPSYEDVIGSNGTNGEEMAESSDTDSIALEIAPPPYDGVKPTE